MALTATYLKKLKQRGKESRIYQKHQLLGLEIAQILGDEKHKSLYIKLAREHGGDELRRLAKDVADRKNIKNLGAYFMKVLSNKEAEMRAAARFAKLTKIPKLSKKNA
jgi:hypothetical protein